MFKGRIEIKWGLIISVALLLWSILEKNLGWHDEKIEQHPVLSLLVIVIYPILYYFALVDKREADLNGKMSWKQGVVSGIFISLMVAAMSPLVQYLTHQFISPDFFRNAIQAGVDGGHTTVENAKQFFNLKSYMMMSAIMALVFGLIASAISAILAQRKA